MTPDSIRLTRTGRSGSLDEVLDEVLDAAVGAIDLAVVVTDADGRVELWNGAAENLYGWSASEAIGELSRDLIVRTSGEAEPAIAWSQDPSGDWRGELQSRHRNGSIVPVEVSEVAIRRDDGTLRAIVSLSQNATDPLIAQRERDALQALADAAAHPVMTIDGEVIVSWSGAAERMLGWSADEIVGQSVWTLVPEDRAAEFRHMLRQALRGQPVPELVTERSAKDGSLVPVSLAIAPVFDAALRRWLAIVTMSDCRTSDELIAAAVEAQIRLRLFQAGTTEIVLVLDADGAVRAVSSAVEKVLGVAPSELVGAEVVSLVHPEDAFAVQAAIDRVRLGDGVQAEVLYRRRTVDGSWRLAEAAVTNMLQDPIIAGIVVNIRDVNEREVARAALVEREAMFRSMFEQSSDLAMLVTPHGVITEVTPSSTHVLGRRPERLVGRAAGAVLGPDVDALLGRNRAHGDHDRVTFELRLADRPAVWIEVEVRNLSDDVAVRGFVLNVRDVTEKAVAANSLMKATSRLAAVIDRSSDVAVFFERDGTIGWISPAALDVFGLVPSELIGTSIHDLAVPDDRVGVRAALESGLTGTGDHLSTEFRLVGGDGRVRWVEQVATDLLDDPNVAYVVANLRDITDRRVAHERLARLAMFDSLTGLPNRNSLAEQIGAGLMASSPDRVCGLIAISVDDFCDVKDTVGRSNGDALLMALAQRMQLRLPPGSMLARTGGETFAVFCPDLADLEACLTVAGSMHAALAGPLRIDGEDIFTAVSTGVTIGPAEDAESLVHQADIALTRSERLGRSQTVVFEPELDVESQDRLHITRDLRVAIDRGEIAVHYQPVVELATGRVRAVEALARWEHPERGMVSPDSFIAVAESTGLVSELGAQVLSRACADIARWNAAGRRLVCAVNASAIQLIDPGFAEHVIDRVTSAGLDVKQLTIEITETAAFRDFAAVSRTLDALVAGGIKVSLDDFGTGYSSLSVLQRLPVGGLKIDRSFVSGLGGSDEGRIVTGVVQLGRALDLHVVAEGVEAPQQLEFLRQAGCEFGQGYLWSPAVPADRLLATIADIERDLPPVD